MYFLKFKTSLKFRENPILQFPKNRSTSYELISDLSHLVPITTKQSLKRLLCHFLSMRSYGGVNFGTSNFLIQWTEDHFKFVRFQLLSTPAPFYSAELSQLSDIVIYFNLLCPSK